MGPILITAILAAEYMQKHRRVTTSPNMDTLPKLRKNIFVCMLKPALKIIGGRKILKNSPC